METFANQLAALTADGYKMAEAQAKVAHDAILFVCTRAVSRRTARSRAVW